MDNDILASLTEISDSELLTRVQRLAAREREVTAGLIAHMAELDVRRLYLDEGHPSLFAYCTQALHLSEHAAYGRIAAARAARKFPVIFTMLADGSVNLTTVCLLAPHLTRDNHVEILGQVRHKSKREVELLVARLQPLPAVSPSIRKLPNAPAVAVPAPASAQKTKEQAPVSVAPPPIRPAVVAPLAPERYKVQFTISAELYAKLRRAQDLLRHQIPNGDPAAVFEKALDFLLCDIERKKLAVAKRPRRGAGVASGSRHIPAEVKRAVLLRDREQCAFVGKSGRCTERGFLEFHHVNPYAAGGEATVSNIELRCAAHNRHEATLYFGPDAPYVRESPGPYTTRSGPSLDVTHIAVAARTGARA
jgi:5-methylcytosine-specific restriction endonuclease McrA